LGNGLINFGKQLRSVFLLTICHYFIKVVHMDIANCRLLFRKARLKLMYFFNILNKECLINSAVTLPLPDKGALLTAKCLLFISIS